MPPAPDARISSATIAPARSGESPSARAAWNAARAASGTIATPAAVAVATPKTRCTVGRPRRTLSSSMHGRSS